MLLFHAYEASQLNIIGGCQFYFFKQNISLKTVNLLIAGAQLLLLSWLMSLW